MKNHIPDATKMACPFCAADAKPEWAESSTPWFACGTMVLRYDIGREDQTKQCEKSERERITLELTTLRTGNAALVERVARLQDECRIAILRAERAEEQVRRLEEAGDAMAHAEGCMCDDGVVCHKCFDRTRDWRKAKATA